MENEKELEIELQTEKELEIEIGLDEKDLGIEFKEDILKIITSDYNKLINLPFINKIKLQGNKTAKELGLQEELETISNLEIEKIFNM